MQGGLNRKGPTLQGDCSAVKRKKDSQFPVSNFQTHSKTRKSEGRSRGRRRITAVVESEKKKEKMGKPLGPTGEFFRRRDEWRKHPMMIKQFRHATPGLGIALVAFGVYLVGEQIYERVGSSSSSHSH